MRIFDVSFTGGMERTSCVRSFRFDCAEKIDFLPGQFLKLIFDEAAPENGELNKYLSFSCSPHRGYIEVTKKLTGSRFSLRLQALKTGEKVKLQAPMGRCTLHPEYSRVGFICGGIGITPVISMIDYMAYKGFPADAVLFYSNRTAEETAFKRDLDLWKTDNGRLKVHYAVTDCRPPEEGCFYGRIDRAFIEERDPLFKERTVFIFGPPVMVTEMRGICSQIGCLGSNIKSEGFTGY